jgi:hypothetical protein
MGTRHREILENEGYFMFTSDLKRVKPADEVAVMPRGGRSPYAVLTIAKVRRVGDSVIQTSDGGVYVAADGGDVNLGHTLYIEPATDEHRRALHTRRLLAR